MTAYEMRISDWSSDVCSSDLWTDSVKLRACDSAFWPVVASSTSRVSCGTSASSFFKTRTTFSSSCIRLLLLCRRPAVSAIRSEERRVGKEWVGPVRCRWSPFHEKVKVHNAKQKIHINK